MRACWQGDAMNRVSTILLHYNLILMGKRLGSLTLSRGFQLAAIQSVPVKDRTGFTFHPLVRSRISHKPAENAC